jgi:hypothetical protein
VTLNPVTLQDFEDHPSETGKEERSSFRQNCLLTEKEQEKGPDRSREWKKKPHRTGEHREEKE